MKMTILTIKPSPAHTVRHKSRTNRLCRWRRIMLTALLAYPALMQNSCAEDNHNIQELTMQLSANGNNMTVTMNDNAAAAALLQHLETNGPLTICMSDYGDFEKVGSLGMSLPRSDKQTTTQPGDIVLYQGNQLVIFYGSNSWSYTRLGHIDNATSESLRSTLGTGDVTVTLSAVTASGIGSTDAEASVMSTRVFSTDGRLLLSIDGELDPATLKRGNYVIKTTLSNGQTEVRKTVI